MPKRNIIAAVDIGSSKVAAMIAEVTEQDQLNVLSVAAFPSRGVKKGVIVNLDATIHAVERAMAQAQQMANVGVNAVSISLSGSQYATNAEGALDLAGQPVVPQDIEQVIAQARLVETAPDDRLLHILPQGFSVDDHFFLAEPLGEIGDQLRAYVHLIYGRQSLYERAAACVERAGFGLAGTVSSGLASSLSVLTEDEKKLGVCLLDIGAGTTDILVMIDGVVQYSNVLPVGGNQATSDIAHIFKMPSVHAEAIKLQHGVALSDMVQPEDTFEVNAASDGGVQRASLFTLAEVIESRYEEIFHLVAGELAELGLAEHVSAGFVLTGGAARAPGLIHLAQDVFHMPVRLGAPQYVLGVSDLINQAPYATLVGLLMYAKAHEVSHHATAVRRVARPNIWRAMKSWVQEVF